MTQKKTEFSENMILKKRLNQYRSTKGALIHLSEDLVLDVVKAWERWPGTSASFYRSLGIKRQQLAFIIKKGKHLLKEGRKQLGSFTPIQIQAPISSEPQAPMVLNWNGEKTIQFYHVEHLVEFLHLSKKKAA